MGDDRPGHSGQIAIKNGRGQGNTGITAGWWGNFARRAAAQTPFVRVRQLLSIFEILRRSCSARWRYDNVWLMHPDAQNAIEGEYGLCKGPDGLGIKILDHWPQTVTRIDSQTEENSDQSKLLWKNPKT